MDFAFNNAGVGPEDITIPRVHLIDYDEKYWDQIIDTNLKGVFLCLKHELRQMRKQGHGVIVNTSSVGGLRAAHRVPEPTDRAKPLSTISPGKPPKKIGT